MPSFDVITPQRSYRAIVERGVLKETGSHIPASAGKIFIVTNRMSGSSTAIFWPPPSPGDHTKY